VSDIEDVDKRFNELTAQIDRNEQRKMNKAAAQEWARLPGVRRRRNRRIAAFAVVAVVAGAGLFVAYRPEVVSMIPGVVSERFSDMDINALRLGQVPEETTPVDVRPPKLSPFEGSPAMDYADGAKGLVMPTARATGGLSRKDVAAALERTRDMLKASHLDRRTLMGGRPTALAKLLPPELRGWFLKNLDHGKTEKSVASSTRGWVTSLAPKTAELATDVIKVKGKTKYSAFRKHGRSGARITVNYLFVYAIHRPGRPEPTQRVIAQNRGEILAYRENGELVMWPASWNAGSITGVRCDAHDGFAHPFYDDSIPDEQLSKATNAPIDPYDLDDNSKIKGCMRTART
jgi:hypothetical protein